MTYIHVFSAGVIDMDYRGSVGVLLFNHGDEDFLINEGDRIAQLICEKIVYPEIEEVQVSNVIFCSYTYIHSYAYKIHCTFIRTRFHYIVEELIQSILYYCFVESIGY